MTKYINKTEEEKIDIGYELAKDRIEHCGVCGEYWGDNCDCCNEFMEYRLSIALLLLKRNLAK